MSPGQTRVMVLLIVLLALEMIVHPGVKQFISGAIGGVRASLGGH